MQAIYETSFTGLKFSKRGKVRDLYDLGDALLRLTALHPVPEATVRDLTQTLGLLHSHVVDCAQAARR